MMPSLLGNKSIKNRVLLFFLPVIILSSVLTGLFSYLIAEGQLIENARYLLNDTVHQTNILINDKFSTMLEQLVVIEDDSSFSRIVSKTKRQSQGYNDYDDIIQINNRFEDVFRKYFQIIDSIYINFNNEREFKLQKDYIVARRVGIDLNDWKARYADGDAGYYWLNLHEDTVFDTVDRRNVLSVFKMIGSRDTEINGVILINLRSEYFLNILNNVRVSPNGYLLLVSPEGAMYSKNMHGSFTIGEEGMAILRDNVGNSGSFNVQRKDGEKMFVVFNTLQVNNWILAAVVPEQDILQKAGQIKYASLAVTAVLIVVFSVIGALFAGSISNPIRFLSRQVKLVEKGNFDAKFDIADKSEIGVLASGLTRLVNTVKNLLEKVREEQEQKRQIELLALQSQINPHFLYNTLGSIKHLINMDQKKSASQMVSALTRFFQIGISKGKEIISVREELEHIHSYLMIQKIRYSREFDFAIEVDEEVMDCKIIKLTLQPIIENSIYHGIKNKSGPGLIRVSGRKEEGRVVLEVYDDGEGMSEKKLEKLLQSINSPQVEENPITFGLRNVQQRILLHFGSEYGLAIESEEHRYTCVRIKIPFVQFVRGDENV